MNASLTYRICSPLSGWVRTTGWTTGGNVRAVRLALFGRHARPERGHQVVDGLEQGELRPSTSPAGSRRPGPCSPRSCRHRQAGTRRSAAARPSTGSAARTRRCGRCSRSPCWLRCRRAARARGGRGAAGTPDAPRARRIGGRVRRGRPGRCPGRGTRAPCDAPAPGAARRRCRRRASSSRSIAVDLGADVRGDRREVERRRPSHGRRSAGGDGGGHGGSWCSAGSVAHHPRPTYHVSSALFTSS